MKIEEEKLQELSKELSEIIFSRVFGVFLPEDANRIREINEEMKKLKEINS